MSNRGRVSARINRVVQGLQAVREAPRPTRPGEDLDAAITRELDALGVPPEQRHWPDVESALAFLDTWRPPLLDQDLDQDLDPDEDRPHEHDAEVPPLWGADGE